jgi:hypothetical protein
LRSARDLLGGFAGAAEALVESRDILRPFLTGDTTYCALTNE